jgi:hypothetical protein
MHMKRLAIQNDFLSDHSKVGITPDVLYFAGEYFINILVSDFMPMVDMIEWDGYLNVLWQM